MKTKAMLEAADVATILQAAQAEAKANNWAVTMPKHIQGRAKSMVKNR